MKARLWLLPALLLLAFLSGCDDETTGDPAPGAPAPQALVIYQTYEPRELHLRWVPNQYAVETAIYRAPEVDGPWEYAASVDGYEWIDPEFEFELTESYLRGFYQVRDVFPDGTQSGPSNTVGWVGVIVEPGVVGEESSTYFSLPFTFWLPDNAGVPVFGIRSNHPLAIIGDQSGKGTIGTGDLISEIGGSYCWSIEAGVWDGGLNELHYGESYSYQNRSGMRRFVFLLGDTGVQATVSKTIGDPPEGVIGYASTPFSWPTSRPLEFAELELLEKGFLGGDNISSDRISMPRTSADSLAWYSTAAHSWQGTIFQIIPGKAYYIANAHGGHQWHYSYSTP